MYPVGLSSCGKPLCEELFIHYREAGIDAIEISTANEEYDTMPYERLAAWASTHQVKIWSLHLPFMPFQAIDISSLDRTLQQASIARLSEIIKRGAAVGIDKFVIHPSGEPIADEVREDRLLTAQECLYTLADVAARCGGMIAVENLPRTCLGRDSRDILELLSCDSRLVACFDTNHLLEEDPIEFIKKIGNKIVTLHVSDYDFKNERHWLPGEGLLDWQSIISALEGVGYDGVWLYEINLDCPWTIKRPRDLTYEDFYRNAMELFENKPLTIFSAPVLDLKKWNE